MKIIIKIFIVFLAFFISLSTIEAQQSTAELAKAAQNPIANMMSFPFQNNTAYNIGPYSRTQNVLNIQPVLPFADGRIITRTIIPIGWTPDYATEDETSVGLGDINITAFYSPASEGFTWGIGPVINFPTGGDVRGNQKWCAGPSLIMLAMPGKWVVGFLINNIWSFAGAEEAPDVNRMLFQPIY